MYVCMLPPKREDVLMQAVGEGGKVPSLLALSVTVCYRGQAMKYLHFQRAPSYVIEPSTNQEHPAQKAH